MMTTDLALHIQETPMVDTHEHMRKEQEYVEAGPDILQSLFQNYMPSDLTSAGADPKAVAALVDNTNPDVRGRFSGIQKAWAAVRLNAKLIYGMDEITAHG